MSALSDGRKRAVRRGRAFTLIELLVVIAIIAILAAILFPVFAQAKLAAKKTVDLSNLKGTNLGTMMYLADNEDRYPLNSPKEPAGDYLWGYVGDIPWNLASYDAAHAYYYEENLTTWGNSIQPYLKSVDLLRSPVQNLVLPDWMLPFVPLWVRPPGAASYAMNGLLEQWSATAIARPAQLVSFSAPWGGTAINGEYSAQPFLLCEDPNAPCVYQPPRNGCGVTRNGELSGYYFDTSVKLYLQPSFGNGSNFAYADGSAKFRRMFGDQKGKTDYRTDPYSAYDAQGHAHGTWWDPDFCHALLYRPDFDFDDFGSPVEAVGG